MTELDKGDAPQPTFRLLGQQARQSLLDAGLFVRSHSLELSIDDRRGRKWDLFVDQPIDSIETCAISCAVIALFTVGGFRSSMVDEAVQTLLRLQLPSGGWTSWLTSLEDLANEDPEEALVVDTYFALAALKSVEMEHVEQFSLGIEWFHKAQDEASGGWGFYPDAPPQILPTCMAIVSLSYRDNTSDPLTRSVIDRGVEWLLSRQGISNEPGWSIGGGTGASAVHTAWALRALVSSGFDSYSPSVVAARDWLLKNMADRSSVIDHYVTPGVTFAGRRRPSRAITHINFPEGIIVRGLLMAGAYILDPRLLAAVEQLIRDQQPAGYWRCIHAPKEQPIYALTDACVALRLFVDRIQAEESHLEISEQILEYRAIVSEVAARVDTALAGAQITDARLTEIMAHVGDVRRQLEDWHEHSETTNSRLSHVETRLAKLDGGLVGLRPMMWLTQRIVRWPVLTLLVILQVVAYYLVAFTVPPEYRLLSLAGSALLTLATAITFWAQMRTLKPMTQSSNN